MVREVLLIACSTDSNISAWDFTTGTQLTQYKANASPRNGVCLCGRDYIVAAQGGKDSLHFWAWHKDQVHQRSFAQERLTAVAASGSGAYIAAGGASGALYVWEAASGQLLRTWAAHYKAVSALCFLEGSGVLLSGGEDTLAAAWALGDVLDAGAAQDPHARVNPLHSWAGHSLPVTAIACGLGEANAVVATASLDRTAKLWSVATGALLRTLPLPAGATALALDPGEHSLYIGTVGGPIYEASLLGGLPRLGAAASEDAAADFAVLEGHTGTVNSLAVSADGEALLSGSADGSVCVWDMRSRACVRVIPAPSRAPVTAALLATPPEPLGGAAAAAGGAARKGPPRPQPLAPLAKFPAPGGGGGGGGDGWEGPPTVLDGSCPPRGIAQRSGLLGGGVHVSDPDPPPPEPSVFAAAGAVTGGAQVPPPDEAAAGAAAAAPEAGGLQEQVARLQRELEEARRAAERWQQLHSQLHAFCVEQVLPGAGAL